MIVNKKGNKEQGGLDVSITIQCAISSEKRQIMQRLKQLINKRLRDPCNFQGSGRYDTKKKVRH